MMGFAVSKLSWFWTSAGYDTPDPATGLTPRQKDIVRNTWKSIRADTRNNGIKLFLKFFEAYPEYQLLFKSFANVPLSDLPRNGRLLGHVTSVMYALNSVVDNLEDPECLIEILQKTGISHRPRNVNRQHFNNLKVVLIKLLVEILGSNVMNESAVEAWEKTLDVANSIIIKSLEAEGDA
ncbi:Globin, partial [Stegodyphus mimosarum]